MLLVILHLSDALTDLETGGQRFPVHRYRRCHVRSAFKRTGYE